jgi:uncharacterized protein with PQ loop repeat
MPLHDRSPVVGPDSSAPPGGLERLLRAVSIATMLMTVPQVLTIWIGRDAGAVSLVAWLAYLFSACLWFVYGLRKKDKTIYVACLGWILLDTAVVVGVIVYS